jgi:hypothetical protein
LLGQPDHRVERAARPGQRIDKGGGVDVNNHAGR